MSMEDLNINKTVVNATFISDSSESPENFHQSLEAKVLQATLWSTVVFLGIIGNILVCAVILGLPKMKTSMNFYLLSLAIADLGVLTMLVPINVIRYFIPVRWVLGKFFCLYLSPTLEIFFGASIWSITIIAIERYRNICGANRYRIKSRSQMRTKLTIFGVWLASFLVGSVPVYPVMAYKPNPPTCHQIWPNRMYLAYSLALVLLWYVSPLAVIAFTYLKIKKRIRESVVFRNSMSIVDDDKAVIVSPSSQSKKRQDKQALNQSNKTRRILTPLVILFAVTMLPLNVYRTAILFAPEFSKNPYTGLIFGQIILFVGVNSSINPIVYYIVSKEFKDAFKKIFQKLREKEYFFKTFSLRGRETSATLVRVNIGLENNWPPSKNLDRNNSNLELLNANVQVISGVWNHIGPVCDFTFLIYSYIPLTTNLRVRGSITYNTDRENEVSNVFIKFLGSNRVRRFNSNKRSNLAGWPIIVHVLTER